MPKDTNDLKKEEKAKKVTSKTTKKVVKKEETKVSDKKRTAKAKAVKSDIEEPKKEKKKTEKKVENKSIQNKVINNIKDFITKIIEMQEKVKKDEETDKKTKKMELDGENTSEIELKAPKYLLEYYDLPFRYNETVVKILAQTPKRLFVYWDVADKDKQTYINAFGENFFNDTYPVLLVHNEDKNYTSEIVINDFANSWYLDISNPRDKYTIQLGRKFKPHVVPEIKFDAKDIENISLNNDYLFIAISNKLEVPNDHVLFEEFKPKVKYRNVKTYAEEVKNIEISEYRNELKELYKELYNDEFILDENGCFDMRNPSSMGTSSSIAK